ncbi:MAG: hypothetical protein IT201_09650 [Thermoleophilia bacterium]|nr:hypothetical protein [Thermoleophilia bacterium]
MSTTESEIPIAAELARVVDWRLRELLRAGYEPELARRIAERTDVDLHFAVDLVRQGCPPRTAADILL